MVVMGATADDEFLHECQVQPGSVVKSRWVWLSMGGQNGTDIG